MTKLGPGEPGSDKSDLRQYVRVSLDLPWNGKIAEVDEQVGRICAGWAQVVALCICAQSMTDGHFSIQMVRRLAGIDEVETKAMVAADLWHEPGHDCDRCPQPRKGMAYVHDYLLHQRSAESIQALSSKRAEVGRKGAESRWGTPAQRAARKATEKAPAKKTGAKAGAQDNPANKPPARPRGTRIPDDFAPTAEMIEWARRNTPHVGVLETQKFVNYWKAKAGKDATKIDWVLTWKNWMITAEQRAGRPAGEAPRSPGAAKAGRALDVAARLDAQDAEQRRAS
jgi:hypothetical protein